MKREVGKGLARFALLVVMIMIAVGTSAKAQSLQYRLTANIPFDFTVGNKKFQAGEYSFRRAQESAGDLIVRVSSKDGHENATGFTVPVIRLNPRNKASLVFHRYGNEYFLFQVWPAGAGTGRALRKSRGERDVERKVHDNMVGMAAMKAPAMEIVTVEADQQ